MKERMQTYLTRMDTLLDQSPAGEDWEAIRREHLRQIARFQHERLAHLLVTLAFAGMFLAVALTLASSFTPGLAALLALLGCLLVPYIFHYYFLENGVQRMYVQDDRLAVLCGAELPWME